MRTAANMATLINLNPALEVALLGAVLALLPAGLVVRRARRQGLTGWPSWQRVLTVLTLFLTLDLVVFGAFTRLTDSGLGCPDWPGCYGEANPLAAHSQISAAQQALPSGPVSHSKAWIEMVHRYLATAVGALITGLMLQAWRMRQRPGGLSPWWASATFVWVCGQGAFGALTVTLKLQPIIVTGHLIGAMLGVGLLAAQVRALDKANGGSLAAVATPPAVSTRNWQMNPPAQQAWARSGTRRWGWGLLVLLGTQIALGAWVSTNYAVLACTEVPLCQGQWWPEMDFATGFHLLRPLGGDGQGAFISLAALTAIHMVHRLAAVLVLVALLAYGAMLRAWSSQVPGEQSARPLRREGLILWGLALWQVASGLSNVVLGWPLVAALAHTLGAALLVWRLVYVLVCPSQALVGKLSERPSSTDLIESIPPAPTSKPSSPQPVALMPPAQGLHAGARQAHASS
jgi:cytochrome c oxidase assembly protein subunit 15